MRLPFASGANSAGRVAVALERTTPASTAALAGLPATKAAEMASRTVRMDARRFLLRAGFTDVSFRGEKRRQNRSHHPGGRRETPCEGSETGRTWPCQARSGQLCATG